MANLSSDGGALSRQISASHYNPRSLSGYEDFFRQNSSPESGWLKVRVDNERAWSNRWVDFENWVLSVKDQPGAQPILNVPMDQVVSFRTDNSFEKESIVVGTTQRKIILQAANSDDMKKWLFCFQKSVAMVYSQLIGQSTGASRKKAVTRSPGAQGGVIAPGMNSGRRTSMDATKGKPGM